MRAVPRYPVYVISKGRWAPTVGLTARFLLRDEIPFRLVIEPQEYDSYAAEFDEALLEVLPFSNLGLGSIPARNFCWEHAKAAGAERHWILDDNIRQFHRLYRGKRIPCDSGPAFRAAEDFTDRYTNLAICGFNYHMFGLVGSPPFRTNVHVYSALLIQNDLPVRWRGKYNEDTDLCLQVLAHGLCTALINVFLIEKMVTMVNMTGGNAAELYQGDGRLRMARSLERQWPHTVTVDRRFQRPQHVVRGNWRKFDTPLILRDGVNLSALPKTEEYGVKLNEIRPVVSPALRKARDTFRRRARRTG